jgi:hypothetical protein
VTQFRQVFPHGVVIMSSQRHKAVIVRAVYLDRRGMTETGRVGYALLILDETGQQIVARPFGARTLQEVIDYALLHRDKAKLGRIKFDPPPGVDGAAGKFPRRYEALTLHEIFYASPALGQS